MYINDRRPRVRPRRKPMVHAMQGLSGPSDCGSDQVWCADFVFPGLPPGQCVTKAQCDAYHASNPGNSSSDNSGVSSAISSIAGAVGKIFGSQPAQAPVVVQGGMSTTTMIALGGAALVGVYLITRKS